MLQDSSDAKRRCFGNGPEQALYADYHDNEWGIPLHDDRKLFEMLILEGAQAGLSWETILKKREGYRDAFYHFDPLKVAAMTDAALEEQVQNSEIVRNRLKIFAARRNARVFLEIQKKFGSFDTYLWAFAEKTPLVTRRSRWKEVPTSTEESIALSKDLKKRGMSFVGPTILYAFMQAVGMVDDHLIGCWKA